MSPTDSSIAARTPFFPDIYDLDVNRYAFDRPVFGGCKVGGVDADIDSVDTDKTDDVDKGTKENILPVDLTSGQER